MDKPPKEISELFSTLRNFEEEHHHELEQACSMNHDLRKSVFCLAGRLIRCAGPHSSQNGESWEPLSSDHPPYEEVVKRILAALDSIGGEPVKAEGNGSQPARQEGILAEVYTDLRATAAKYDYHYIEFDMSNLDLAPVDLEEFMKKFQPVRTDGNFIQSGRRRRIRKAGTLEVVTCQGLDFEKFRIYQQPSRGLMALQSWPQLTKISSFLNELKPVGQEWICPVKLIEFILEACRFLYQGHDLSVEQGLKVRWRTGFIRHKADRDLAAGIPVEAQPVDLDRLPMRDRAAPLKARDSEWMDCRRVRPEGSAFDIVRVIYEQCGLKPHTVPFCDGDEVSIEKLRGFLSI